jgi:hypothetical protein
VSGKVASHLEEIEKRLVKVLKPFESVKKEESERG